MFSMNRAAATISGIRRSLFMRARGSKRTVERGCSTDRAIPLLRSGQAFLNPWRVLGGPNDDLRARRLAAADRAVVQRTTVFGHPERGCNRALRDFRVDFPDLVPGAVRSRADRGPHEAGGPPAPRGGRRDPGTRAAAELPALNHRGKAFV